MRQKFISISQCLRLPAVCILCNQYHPGNFTVCDFCTSFFVRIEHSCSICRLPLPDKQFLQCGYCIKEKPVFEQVFTAYSYEEPLRTLLHEFKYKKNLHLRAFLGKLMLDALPAPHYRSDCLIPVPMHPLRLKQRGFNQAAELAKFLAKKIKLPCNFNLCEKLINTNTQASLDKIQRRKNLTKTFRVKPNAYQHVTLVDDLLTTGSTANELALALKEQGVNYVDVWCLARTPTQ